MVAGWSRLAHKKLDSANATIDTGTFDAKEHLQVIIYTLSASVDHYCYIRYNGDGASNRYTYLKNANGEVPDGSPNLNMPYNDIYVHTRNGFYVMDITNYTGKEKLGIMQNIGGSTGKTNPPSRREYVSKWVNTSDQITQITVHQGNGSNTFDVGSYITVWGRSDDVSTDEKATLTGGLPIGTRYEETDTRKIYRSTSVYSSVDSTASSLTDVPFDASTQIGDITYSGNELTRSADTYARHGLNSNFYFRNSGTQTVECVAQNTGTSSWVFFGLSASKLVDDGANTSTAPNQMAYGIKAADDGRTWIKSGAGNSWTQVSDTSDNTTFKITNNRTTVTYYVNGSSVGSTTHGTPASTYYIAALVSQTGTDGSFVFDYSGDITTASDNGWKERGSA